MNKLVKQLQNPPKEYRAIPFWSWNDKLEPEMLRWQIREMEKAGLGGYFMHARGGLQTPYMGEEWMECVEACIDEGSKLGMGSWCYDEEGWPSGFAGGMVTGLGDKYHVRWLSMKELQPDSLETDFSILGVYGLDEAENTLKRIEESKISGYFAAGKKIVAVGHKSNPYYIDILNAEVVRAFIDSTYEKYHEKFGEHFGKTMPGFFTDEPQFSRGEIPWSYILPERFEERYGYSLLESLPALFLECKGYERLRYDFWQLVNELYTYSFGEQIYNWCEEHHCKFTGHVMSEDNLFSQMGATAGVMPFYEFMHTPGMDWLGRWISNPVVPKQVGSAAAQLGKKFVLSETFALCGWDVSFEELKWIAEWQYVNGVSLMCQHLEGYSLRGLRKRDYPPSMFYQQSWWEEYRAFNDYFARLGMLLTSGKSAAKVLLLHPIKSAWIAYNHGMNDTAMEKLDKAFNRATETLSGLHLEHHYGDETIIRRHGRIENNRFVVGNCEYAVVVLPSMLSLDRSTAELLKQFMDNGGTVVSLGEFPTLCSGISDGMMEVLKAKTVFAAKEDELLETMKKLNICAISIAEGGREVGSIHYQQRDLGDRQVFFLVNQDKGKGYKTTVTLKGIGQIGKYMAETGNYEGLSVQQQNEGYSLELEFLPMQSHVLILDTAAPAITAGCGKPDKVTELQLGREWEIETVDSNSQTLDYCSYSIDGGDWIGPIPVIKLMNILLKRQQNCHIQLKFHFHIDMEVKACGELLLAVEKAEEFRIHVNGSPLQYHNIGWWKDSSFKKVDIRPFVHKGVNEIILEREFYQSPKVYEVLFGENVLETEKNKLTFDVELESIYLVGDFGVQSRGDYTCGDRKAVFTEGPFVITDKPVKVQSGDLTRQGFCFFAGKLQLGQDVRISKTEGERVLVRLECPDAVVSKILVNGQPAKLLLWAPYDVDITDFIHEGVNRISVQLFAGNRNLLGPHHHKQGELYGVCPSSFSDQPGWGPEDGPDQWRDRYCFVRFGLQE
jgi:hypothetical protein